MGFVFFFFVSWLAITLFSALPKSLTFMENTFIYLVVFVISINWSWIIYEELKLVELSKEPLAYTAFLLNRSIALPLIVVLALNAIRRSESMGRSFFYVGLSVSTLLGLVAVGRSFDIVTYTDWNLLYDSIYFVSLHLAAYFALELFRRLKHNNEVTHS